MDFFTILMDRMGHPFTTPPENAGLEVEDVFLIENVDVSHNVMLVFTGVIHFRSSYQK